MSTLLAIMAYPQADATLRMLWKGYKLAADAMVGICPDSGIVKWPEPIDEVRSGPNDFWMQEKEMLPRRLVATLKHFLTTDHSDCCIIEYDTLILERLPSHPGGFVTHLAGGQLNDAECSQFFHTPWWPDRASAEVMLPCMEELIESGICKRSCHGSPDVFMGLVVQRLSLPWTDSNTFSAHAIENGWKEPAKRAFLNGCKFFHGVKKQRHIDAIMQ